MKVSRLLLATLLLTAACKGRSESNDASQFAASLNVDPSTMSEKDGVKYKELVVGTGAEPTRGQVVAVHYVVNLTNGTQVDANGPNDPPLQFRLGMGEMIAGFDAGVSGMKVGGRRQLIVPPALAYGASGSGPVPPNATLVFTIELVSVQ